MGPHKKGSGSQGVVIQQRRYPPAADILHLNRGSAPQLYLSPPYHEAARFLCVDDIRRYRYAVVGCCARYDARMSLEENETRLFFG